MIRESVKELAKQAHKITVEEWDQLTLNTYERNYLYEFLPNEVLLKTCKQHNKHTESSKTPTTYNEAVVAILFPELIRRLEEVLHHSQNNKDNETHCYTKLKQDVKTFLNDSSWIRYKDVATQLELKGSDIKHAVQCGTQVFKDLEKAIKE